MDPMALEPAKSLVTVVLDISRLSVSLVVARNQVVIWVHELDCGLNLVRDDEISFGAHGCSWLTATQWTLSFISAEKAMKLCQEEAY